MALESVTNIDDLNASNPTATDPVSEGDDHLRNIKSALLTCFPSITGAMTCTQAELNVLDGVTAGTVTASKGLVVDSNSKLNVLNVDNVTINTNTISSTDTDGNIVLAPDQTGGTAVVSLTDCNMQFADNKGINDANGNEVVRFQTTTSAVTYLDVIPGATGVNPIIAAQGEADTGMRFENDQSEALMVMECVATPVNWLQVSNAATGNKVQLLNPGEDDVGFTFDAKNSEPMLSTSATAAATTYIDIKSQSTGVNPEISAVGEADLGITFMNDQSEEMLILDAVASAVNEITIKNAATGAKPIIAATGEADNGVEIHNDQGEEIAIFQSAATSVNELTVTSGASGTGPDVAATGDDANIDLTLTSKGTGNVRATKPMLFPLDVVTKTQADSPVSLVAANSGTLYDNTGASGETVYNLPAVATSAGVWFMFAVKAAQAITPTSNSTETIRNGSGTGTDKITSSTQGDVLMMYCDGAEWGVISSYPAETDWVESS